MADNNGIDTGSVPASRPDNPFGSTRGNTVHTLIRRARLRLIANDLFAQGAVAASAALAVFILLLLLGTQVMDWKWLLAVPAVTLGWGFILVFKRRPSPYIVAQVLDRRLGFRDTLSTAVFFHEQPSDISPEVREWQHREAEQLASGADARSAIPFIVPRGAYAMAALLLVASSLFALRYGVSQRLDLKAPLAAMLRQKFGWEDEHKQETRQAHHQQKGTRNPNSFLSQDDDLRAGEPESLADRAEDLPIPSSEQTAANNSKKDGRRPSDDEIAGENDQNAKNDDLESGDDDAAGAAAGDQKQNQKGKPAPKRPADNQYSSLLSKLQEAMKNLLSRFNLQPPAANSDEEGSVTESRKMAKGKGKDGAEKSAAKNGQKQPGGEQGDPDAGEDGDDSTVAQSGQAKGSAKNGDSEPNSKVPGSGVGSQDGAKDIKQAQQLDAMNKIAEIFGKRSAAVTGEVSVEVQSTSQELQTPYAQKRAQHTEAGAEIGRDEVPVALQGYVEQYFEQVRKPAPAK